MNTGIKFAFTLRRVAEKVARELDTPKLCIVNFPEESQENFWLPPFLDAVLDAYRLNLVDIDSVEIDLGVLPPLEALSEQLGEISGLDDFIEFFSEGYLFVFRAGCHPPSSDWLTFISELATRFKQTDGNRYYPKVILCGHCEKGDSWRLKNTPVVSEFSLWNPLSWEEVRQLVSDLISDESNEIRKAWMTCTYSGASNFDYRVLSRLAERRPKTVEDTIKAVRAFVTADGIADESRFTKAADQYGREWLLPVGQDRDWRHGRVIGASIDRGKVSPWSAIAPSDVDTQVRYFIWRELVTGLFALLIEICRRTAEALFQLKGSDWVGSDDAVFEPSTILDSYPNARLGRMPGNFLSLFTKLRRARNNLAHLRPLELTTLEQIWDLDLRIRGGQVH